jgi:hypothetical protein
MKKDLATHFVFAIALFVLFSVYRDWLNLSFLPFWLGGILGTLLPDVDYLIYVYALKPKDATSQEAAGLIAQRKIAKSWDTLMNSFDNRKGLLVHSASFQTLFLVFSVWMVTSGSLIGMGLVLAFMLHLILDQITDLVELGNFDGWFAGFPVNLDSEQKRWYLVANVIVLLFLGFFF